MTFETEDMKLSGRDQDLDSLLVLTNDLIAETFSLSSQIQPSDVENGTNLSQF